MKFATFVLSLFFAYPTQADATNINVFGCSMTLTDGFEVQIFRDGTSTFNYKDSSVSFKKFEAIPQTNETERLKLEAKTETLGSIFATTAVSINKQSGRKSTAIQITDKEVQIIITGKMTDSWRSMLHCG